MSICRPQFQLGLERTHWSKVTFQPHGATCPCLFDRLPSFRNTCHNRVRSHILWRVHQKYVIFVIGHFHLTCDLLFVWVWWCAWLWCVCSVGETEPNLSDLQARNRSKQPHPHSLVHNRECSSKSAATLRAQQRSKHHRSAHHGRYWWGRVKYCPQSRYAVCCTQHERSWFCPGVFRVAIELLRFEKTAIPARFHDCGVAKLSQRSHDLQQLTTR